jgi:hypothetical protein
VLSLEEEAIVVASGSTLLPLDDCLYTLQATIPHLTRLSLNRCLQRHGGAAKILCGWRAAGLVVPIERLWRSLKYEDLHIKGYADGVEARARIAEWMSFYNHRRPH